MFTTPINKLTPLDQPHRYGRRPHRYGRTSAKRGA